MSAELGPQAMPITYQLDERGRVLTRASGVLDVATLLTHLRRLAEDPDRATPMRELFDAREVTALRFRGVDIRSMLDVALNMRSRLGDAHVALVATSDTVYGMGRVAQALAELTPLSFHVYRTREEAMRWLGMEAPPRPRSAGLR